MKYADKAKARTHPFLYDKDSKSFLVGAHRHWAGCTTQEGFLNSFGQARLRNDAFILSRRPRVRSHVHVNH